MILSLAKHQPMHEQYKIKHFTIKKYATRDQGVLLLSLLNQKLIYLFNLLIFTVL